MTDLPQDEVKKLADRLKDRVDIYGDLGFSQPVQLATPRALNPIGYVEAVSCLYCGTMVLLGGWQTSRSMTQQDPMSAHVHHHVTKGDYVLDEEEFRVHDVPGREP